MQHDPDGLDEAYDELLDRVLRGEQVEIEAFLSGLPALGPAGRERLRARARVLLGPDPGGSGDRLPFEHLGEFHILRRLGAGGMGVVYLAHQASLGRLLALKVVRPELAGSASTLRRFEREARAVGQLRHPAIVTVHAAGSDQGVHYLAMEYVEGRSLEELLRLEGPRLAPARAMRWGLELARALDCAHAAGVVHRDVKPSNVLVDGDGRPFLVDFGLALLADTTRLSVDEAFRGTPYYAAPEQVDGTQGPIDARSDVYSLGATLYHCVTGRPPFEGETSAQLFHAILTRDPIPPRRIVPALSRDLETVLLKALEKQPARRYASAAALARDLEALLEMRPVDARPLGPLARGLRWARLHRATSVALGAGLLLAGGLAASHWLARARVARGYERELTSAVSARAAGDLAAARTALDRALFLRPDDPRAAAERAAVERDAAAADARAELERARAALEQYRGSERNSTALVAELAPLRQAVTTRAMSASESQRLTQLEAELGRTGRELEGLFARVIEALNLARGLDPDVAEAEAILADLYMERWRAATATGDSAGARHYQQLVERSDLAGRHAKELRARVSLTLTSEPPGAQVWLFRYREQADCVPGGQPRLVPEPLGGAPPRPPGTWALRVAARAPGFEPEDLILSVAGHPIEGTLLVASPGRGVKPFDRVVSVDGFELRDAYDARWTGNRDGTTTEREFVFERGGELRVLRARRLVELAPEVITPRQAVERGGVRVERWHDGRLDELEAPAGLRVLPTAAPLFRSPGCLAGTTPVEGLELEPGSYLALVGAQGFECLRLPFVLERGRPARLSVSLLPQGTTPPGMVWVPEGTSALGGDPQAFATLEAAEHELPGFWIGAREVTVVEYLEFLNDPATLAEIDSSDVPTRFPRDAASGGLGGLWERRADGTFEPQAHELDQPVHGISWLDAEAFARWRTARAQEQGLDHEVALPTELEWEKAARGADRRAFVFGNVFVPRWVKGHFARDQMLLEPGLSFPVDESPYGVFDMTGSVWEWCQDEWQDARTLRGGGWNFIFPPFFRAASRASQEPRAADGLFGVRLVVRRRAPAGAGR